MATVPVYGDRQVRTTPLQPVLRQTPDVSSGARALGQGLMQVAEAADRIDLRDAQDAAFKAQSAIRDEWGQFSAELRKQYKGDQADQYKTEAGKWWEEAKKRYTAELNPRAQALASRQIGEFKLAQDNNTTAYVEREKATARKINFETLQDSRIREAAINATPETAAAIAAATAEAIRKDSIAYAAAEGFGSEVGERMANERIDKFHSAMALTLASRPNGKERATEYLNKFGGEMPMDLRARVDEQIELTSEKAKTKATKDLYGNLRYGIENGIWPTKDQYEQLRQLDPLSAATLKQAENAERKAKLAEARGESVRTDFAAWYGVYNDIIAGKQVDLLTYRDRVSPGDLKALATLQQKPEKIVQARMDQDDFNAVADTMGLAPYRANTEDKKRELGYLKSRVESVIDVEQQSRKRELTREEKRKLMQEELAKTVTVDGFFTNSNKPVIQLKPEEVTKVVVPDDQRSVLVDEMKRLYSIGNNPMYAPTEANLKRYYLLKRSPAANFIE